MNEEAKKWFCAGVGTGKQGALAEIIRFESFMADCMALGFIREKTEELVQKCLDGGASLDQAMETVEEMARRGDSTYPLKANW